MSTSKHIDKICIAVVALTLVVAIVFMNGQSLGLVMSARTVKYESTLFDTSYVHQIDIVMDDWDSFIESCENEEYTYCTAVIDGEKHSNIAIRAKGNTSLSNVKSMNSQRYSFKLEFDHYESAKMLDGLDKLCLNNLIQDNTMMKDYIVYQLMNDFGVESPLCSFAYLTVNGEDWGLYLAVEGIEDSFLSRNYGSDTGELYKPDSLSFGGGRGNGKDFDMDNFDFGSTDSDKQKDGDSKEETTADTKENETTTAPAQQQQTQPTTQQQTTEQSKNSKQSITPLSFGGGQTPPEGFDPENMPSDFNPENMPSDFDPENMPSDFGGGQTPPDGFNPGDIPNGGNGEAVTGQTDEQQQTQTDTTAAKQEETTAAKTEETTAQQTDNQPPQKPDENGQESENNTDGKSDKGNFSFGGGMGGGMGSDDVKLKYIDDDADSYSNIFDNAKTDITDADKQRLIQSLKKLSEYSELESVVNIDEVIRYFVVHNFVCNGDSYTGSMIHNYYLHESDGRLSMIPWDYNLAFGTFQGGNASGTVNTSIDSPVSNGNVDDRPMLGWIFSDESYTEQYHTVFEEFIEKWFTDGELEKMITDTADMLRSYVEKDPTKFCTTEEFEAGVTALKQFASLRGQAVKNQLAGDDTTVETGNLNLSDMGTMGGGKGGNDDKGGGMDFGNFSFDASSFIKLTDSEGNEVELSTLIDDITSIVSATLSDGTTVDLSSDDFSSLIKTDFSRIVSVTDKEGKVIDLSGYTISINMPSFNGNGGMPNMSDMPSFGGKGNSDENGNTPPAKPDGDSENGNTPPEKPNENGNEQTTDNAAEKTDTDTTSAADNQNEPKQDNAASQGDGNGGDSKTRDMKMPTDTGGGTSDTMILILTGCSILVLALGILIAVKKKY